MHLRTVAYKFCIGFVLSSIGPSSPCFANQNAETTDARVQHSVSSASLVATLFDEEIVADNVFAVRRRHFKLSPSGRYDYLASWVLPSETHTTIRLSGAFSPTEVVPLTPEEYLDSDGSGGQLISPVFDLLDAARSLGRLEDLHARVDAMSSPRTETQQRARAAMLILLAMELNDDATVAAEVNRLRALVTVAVPASVSDQWPETLVAYRSVTRFPKSVACDIVADLVTHRLQRGIPKESAEWHSQIFSLAGRLKTQQISGTNIATESTDVLKYWIPVARTRWIRDAAGVAQASWQWRGDECNHVTGRDEDYLFYRSPLTGNFDVEMDLQIYGTTQFLAGGMLFGPRPNPAEFETGDIRRGGLVLRQMNPPFNKFDSFVRCRASFRNGRRSLFINGRLATSDTLPEHHDPWFGVRSWGRADGRFRNVRISGDPLIPESVALSESQDLTGWYSHLDDSVGGEHAYWQYVRNADQPSEIVGRKLDGAHEGAMSERLLRYIRPLAEDGTIDYDFIYESGKAITHPALDRLAMILAPDGVRIHWVTDDNNERTGILPDNETLEPENRRGPATLPLKPADWNHMKVVVKGDIVTLELNGQLIYERQLESTNQRKFGLFNYADQSVARVRNVVMRGNWPMTVQPVLEQELTNRTLATLDVERWHAKESLTHQFVTDGLPEKHFRVPPVTGETEIVSTANGVTHEQRSAGNPTQSSIMSSFQMYGDFDLSVGFSDCSTTGHDHFGGAVLVNCGSGHKIHLGRRYDRTNDDHGVVVAWLTPDGNGEFRRSFDLLHTEANSGHLRVARRGDNWFAMFAENDSSAYQLVGQHKLEGSRNQPVVFEMQSIATDGGTSHVVWKDLQIAAEKFASNFNLMKTIEGWGDAEDPTGATKIEVHDGVLSITTPAILTDNYPPGAVNAPRVTQEVSGDFTAEVKVLHLDEAKSDSVFKWIGNFPAYHAATLLIRLDDKNCVRFERVSMHRDTTLSTLCVLQTWENAASTMYESVPVQDTVTNLRVERMGAVLRSSYSQDDGKTWIQMGDCKLKALAGTVRVGVSMTNNTDPGSVVRFRDFTIIRHNTSP